MCKRIVICLLTAFLLPTVSLVEARQAKKVPRIGYLSFGAAKGSAAEVFRQNLREIGYIEGQNIVIEWRFAAGKLDPLPGLAAELVRLRVDAIVVSSTQGALAAKKATQTIPIIFAIADNPVESGVIASLAQPGGNLTGVTDMAGELGGKRVELLKETLPKVSRLAVLVWKPDGPGNAAERNEIESAARALGVQVQPVEARGGGAADEIRAGDQSESGKTDRPDDSAVGAVPGG